MDALPDFDALCDTFAILDDWEARYAYLIDLGRAMGAYPAAQQDDAHKVPGCTSQVWMDYEWQGDRLFMRLESDAHLVKGLLAVLAILYDGRTVSEIMAVDLEAAFARLGLERNLSPNRRSGFFAVASRIRLLAGSRA